MLGFIWRFLLVVLDWRTMLRVITGQPLVDVVFISNLRDEEDRKNCLGKWLPKSGHFNGARFWFKPVSGRIRIINSTSGQLASKDGRKIAKEQFKSAVKWADSRGARIVLFAAGCKRLFDLNDMKLLASEYPNITFTIGDNGTASALISDIRRYFTKSNIKKNAKILVLGPTGHLGKSVIHYLHKEAMNIFALSDSSSRLAKLAKDYPSINQVESFEGLDNFDVVISCTHSDTSKLSVEVINQLARKDQKLLVLDVAEPKNVSKETYQICKDKILLGHVGDPYSSNLSYVAGFLSRRILGLDKKVIFGCFAESLVLASIIKGNDSFSIDKIKDCDWLDVSYEKISQISKWFDFYNFTIARPRVFSELIRNFNLKN